MSLFMGYAMREQQMMDCAKEIAQRAMSGENMDDYASQKKVYQKYGLISPSYSEIEEMQSMINHFLS